VAVLAGGRGSRLGGEKTEIELGGRPLISYPLEAARDAGMEAFVVAKPDSRLPALDVEVVHEQREPSHPLVGAIAALEAAPDEVVLVGCDMPFLTGDLLGWLASLEAPATASVAGRLEPFIGLYDSTAAETFERALSIEDSLQRAVAALHPRVIEEAELRRFGPPERLAFSVNSPDDLALAERMLAG
jgi:molybdopterin-guanine dinucleotide biosynthesis protein A